MTSPSEEPAWKQRAVERSIKTAKLLAAQRVQRFLDAAQATITEKGSTDFTVQEVVNRSRQSLPGRPHTTCASSRIANLNKYRERPACGELDSLRLRITNS